VDRKDHPVFSIIEFGSGVGRRHICTKGGPMQTANVSPFDWTYPSVQVNIEMSCDIKDTIPCQSLKPGNDVGNPDLHFQQGLIIADRFVLVTWHPGLESRCPKPPMEILTKAENFENMFFSACINLDRFAKSDLSQQLHFWPMHACNAPLSPTLAIGCCCTVNNTCWCRVTGKSAVVYIQGCSI
jgi:hypothetical protein